MSFIFSQRSRENLAEVHPKLREVMELALARSVVDFSITEGMRDLETQKRYFETGKSRTMASYHLKHPDGFSHACDVAAYIDGKISWMMKYYQDIDDAVQDAAKEVGVTVTWGGSWKTFKDGPHFQIELPTEN